MNRCTNLSAPWVAASMAFFLPLVATASDSDADGLDDAVETNNGIFVSASNTGTDPNNSDTDGDGVPDGLEIRENTNPTDPASFNAFSRGLVAYYPFDGTVNDESGNGNHGTVTGAEAYGNDGIRHFDFNGATKVTAGHLSAINDFPLTVSAWVRGANQGVNSIVTEYVNASWNGWSVAIAGDKFRGSYLTSLYNGVFGGYGNPPFETSTPILDGHWRQVVFVVGAAGGELFADAVVEDSQVWTGGTSHPSSETSLVFGHVRTSGGDYFAQLNLANVRIYNRSLSQPEITALFQAETPPPPTPEPPVLSLDTFYEALQDETVTIDATPISGFPTTFTYQWYFNDTPIPSFSGGTGSSFIIDGLPAFEGTWRVMVTNSEGSAEASFEYRVFVDTDEDGLSDGRETLVVGSDPGKADTDDDGLGDFAEVEIHGTNPLLADGDGDGFLDKFEIETGYDPNSDLSVPDAQVDIRTAVEVIFNAELGATYAIEFSTDSQTWTLVEDNIAGTGEAVERLYSIKDYPKGFFRAERTDQ